MKKIYLLVLSMSLFCLLMARAKEDGRRIFYGPHAGLILAGDLTPGHDTIPRPPVDTLTPPVDSSHNTGDTLHHHGYPPHGDSTHLPGDSTHNPADSTHNPGDTVHHHGYPPHGPGDSTHLPGDSTHNPGDTLHHHGYHPHNPGDSTHNPGDTLHHHGYPPHGPGDSTHLPGDSTHTPGDSTHLPGDSTHLPGDSTHLPGDSTHLPGDSTHLPGDSTHLPGDSTHLPGDSTHLPGDSTHLPGDSTGVPPIDSLPHVGQLCNLTISISRDAQQPNRITFSIADSAGIYDSVFWHGFRVKDSLLLPGFIGASWTNTFTDTGCYYIWVTAIRRDTNLICAASAGICIDSLPSASNDGLKAYPNPVYSQTFIDLNLDHDQKVMISIFNSMGNLVQMNMAAGNKGLNHLSVPTGSLGTGIYYIQVKYGDTTKKSKFQKF